jgi:thiazole synthase
LIDLFHCFGAKPEHRISAEVAAEMLRASRCSYLAVNTHNIDQISVGDDLPVGYASATLGTVRELVGDELGLVPVLNINHPTSAAEAIERTWRAVELTGIRIIKLEVLDASLKVSVNSEVIAAAAQLISDGLEVWPLLTADPLGYAQCVDLGSTMIRVMGSPIGARRGIDAQARRAVDELLADHRVPTMLDGGIGSADDVRAAFDLGFDSVLVNSCLFGAGVDAVGMLLGFRALVDSIGSRGAEVFDAAASGKA